MVESKPTIRHLNILLLDISASEAAKKAAHTTGVATLLSVTVARLGATVAKEAAENTLRGALLDFGVPAGQTTQKASDTTRVTGLPLSVAIAGLRTTVAKEAAKNTPRQYGLENVLL